jgi:hypothetical protein
MTQGTLYCWGANHPLDQARAYHGPKRYPFATEVPLRFLVARMGERCLISKAREQYCWGIVDRETEKVAITPIARDRCEPKSFGFSKPTREPFSTCKGEPPLDAPPQFPPHDYDHIEVSGRGFSGTLPHLNRTEQAVLIDIASSLHTFTDLTTCHNPSIWFNFVDDSGEVVASISGEGCPTLDIWPASTAQLFGRGNVVTQETQQRMATLVRLLKAKARRSQR